ncbi:MAG TPA: hypothetical protein VLD13_05290 [Gaiellaceae bacterium]|nr:hypothetical protein [Gaiellaceae bacterium]
MRRLRPLSEEECYLRCYGVDEATVRVVRIEPMRNAARSSITLTGEELRRLFEVRLDAREAELAA